jgi:hypothetical protein
MASGVADGDEKSEEDGSHAVECGATINRRKRQDDSATDGSFREGYGIYNEGVLVMQRGSIECKSDRPAERRMVWRRDGTTKGSQPSRG